MTCDGKHAPKLFAVVVGPVGLPAQRVRTRVASNLRVERERCPTAAADDAAAIDVALLELDACEGYDVFYAYPDEQAHQLGTATLLIANEPQPA
mgnify:FL=1